MRRSSPGIADASRPLHRLAALAIVAALVASCASGGPRRGDDARELLRLAGSLEANPPRDGSEDFHVDTVAVPALNAFAEVRRAYARLELPLSYYDPDSGRIGSFIREFDGLEGEPASSYLDCGRGASADEYADLYDVSVAMGTRVRPLDRSTSVVETVIRGRARARDVTSNLLRCRSYGALERRVAEIVQALARPQ